MRYVLWSGKASGINLPKTHHAARRMVNASAGWRPAVAELGHRRLTYDPRIGVSCLEIQCHGMPAGLLLPDETPRGLVDHTTVTELGLLLKPHLASGALIELLACQVAKIGTELPWNPRVVSPDGMSRSDFWPAAPAGLAPHTYSASINSQYWDALAGDQARQDREFAARGNRPIPQHAEKNAAAYEIWRAYKWPPKVDGLAFCLALAAASGAIVRASDVSQVETEGSSSPSAVDTFGDWEGHVWDFMPGGDVRHLGYGFKRTQPVVTWRADDPVHNPRPMTGLTADVGLRVGRPNRNPLPA